MHYGFSKRSDTNVNLHVYEGGHPEIELNLLFRDYLQRNDVARDAYAKLKKDLLKKSSSLEKKNSPFIGYTLGKGDFIRSVLKKAGYDRLRFLRCSDQTEWDKAKYFRKNYFFDKISIKDPYAWTFNHKDHEHYVFYQGTDIIGYAHIQLWPECRAAIRIIVIEENVRCQSLGGQFLSMIEKCLKSKNYKSIHAEASKRAVDFYKKYGYSKMPFDDPDGYESSSEDIPLGKVL